MLLSVTVTFAAAVLIAGSALVSRKLVPKAEFTRKQRLARELHIAFANSIGLTTGLIACAFLQVGSWPVVLTFCTLEVFWLLLVYVVMPPERQNYIEWPLLDRALAAAGIVALMGVLVGASPWPMIIGAVYAVLAFFVLLLV